MVAFLNPLTTEPSLGAQATVFLPLELLAGLPLGETEGLENPFGLLAMPRRDLLVAKGEPNIKILKSDRID